MYDFHTFIDSLKTEHNSSLIESIHLGYTACFEASGEGDLTRDEWISYKRDQRESLSKPPGTLSLSGPYPEIRRPLPNSDAPIHRKGKYQPKYSNNQEISKIRRELIAKYGGFEKIKNWEAFQAELNLELKRKGLRP